MTMMVMMMVMMNILSPHTVMCVSVYPCATPVHNARCFLHPPGGGAGPGPRAQVPRPRSPARSGLRLGSLG